MVHIPGELIVLRVDVRDLRRRIAIGSHGRIGPREPITIDVRQGVRLQDPTGEGADIYEYVQFETGSGCVQLFVRRGLVETITF